MPQSRYIFSVLIFASLLIGVNCSFGPNGKGAQRASIVVEGEKRHFLKYLNSNSNMLIIAFHGAKETDWLMRDQSLLNSAALEGNSIVYPQGVAMQWNDARGTTQASQCKVNDTAFIRVLIDSISKELNKDLEVVLLGYSNGGLMAQTYAAQVSDERIKAVISIAAPLPEKIEGTPPVNDALHIVYVAGCQDPIMPISGGGVVSCSGGNVLSSFESARYWCGYKDCPTFQPRPIKVKDNKTLAFAPERYDFSPKVTLIEIPLGGHQIPGGIPLLPKDKFGPYQFMKSIPYCLNLINKNHE